MAGANSSIQMTDLDFNTIKSNFTNYLRSQDTFKDYNFAGSGMSVLLDVLAYNTQYNAYYLNMVANEMFLDSAIQRSSVISHAKTLGYTPRSAIAPTAKVQVVFTNVNDSSLTLPAYSSFLSSSIDGVNYTFITTNSYTENTVNNTVTFDNVEIKQGVQASYAYTVDSSTNPTYTFEISDETIDTTTLQVLVQKSSSNTSYDIYNLATNFTTINSESKVYFLQESLKGTYELYFGDDILGKKLADGNIVNISYLSTEGTSAATANSFVLMDSVAGYSASAVNSVVQASSGTVKETIASIKYQAPKSYSAQGRAVTKEDYITAIQQNSLGYSFDAVNVWGGEENDPPVYGTIFVAVKPAGGYILTETEKNVIETEIIKPISVLTVQPKIIDVDYTYLAITSNVLYNPKLTTFSSTQLKTQILNAIKTFGTSTLNTFNSTFKLSELITTVQATSSSFITNDASIVLQKRFTPDLINSTTYTFNFGTSLKKDIFSKSISVTPSFQYIDIKNNNAVRNEVYLEETPSSTSVIDSISIINPGFGYTSTPTVSIIGDGMGATATALVVNGQVTNIVVTDAGSNYTQAIVQISGGGGSSASASAVLAGNNGVLRTYYYVNGVKTVLNPTAGTVDYNNGIVILTAFNPSDVNNTLGVLSIQAVPTSTIISSSRDKIITLDTFDSNAINVNLTAKS